MRHFLALIPLAVAGLSAPPVHAQTVTYRVCLDGSQVVPPTGSSATGDATLVLNTTTRILTITGSYSGLGTNVTAAHLHGSAGVGANAAEIANINGTGGTTGTLSVSIVLSPAQAQQLQSGRHYIDLHTTGNPAGEIRGQVLQAMNVDCPAALPTDPVLADISGDPDFGPKPGDVVEAFNVSLDCSNAGAPGIYSIILRSGKNTVPLTSSIGNLWLSGQKLLKCAGGHNRNTVRCFTNDVVLPNDVALAGVGYCVQGFCSDSTNRPGRLSNAIFQVIGLGSSYATVFQDTFDGGTLDPSWSLRNPGFMQFSVSSGELHMQPTQAGPDVSWFEDEEGPQIYRNVTGDFMATLSLRAENPGAPGQPPATSFRLGGLLARDPVNPAGNRNSVHVALGSGSDSVPVAAEDKNTVGSNSNFVFHPITQTAGEVRITRTGSVFSLEYRAPGAINFQVLRTHTRSDLPATLSVGPMVYANAATPGIIAHFDEFTIAQ